MLSWAGLRTHGLRRVTELSLRILPVVAAVLLLRMALIKIRDFHHFHGVVRQYQPAVPTHLAARAWVAAEVVAAATILLPVDWRYVPAAAVVGSAGGAVGKRLLQHATHSCGCGSGDRPIDWMILVRNAALVLILAGLTLAGAGASVATSLGLAASFSFVVGFLLVGRSVPQVAESAPPVAREPIVVEKVQSF